MVNRVIPYASLFYWKSLVCFLHKTNNRYLSAKTKNKCFLSSSYVNEVIRGFSFFFLQRNPTDKKKHKKQKKDTQANNKHNIFYVLKKRRLKTRNYISKHVLTRSKKSCLKTRNYINKHVLTRFKKSRLFRFSFFMALKSLFVVLFYAFYE